MVKQRTHNPLSVGSIPTRPTRQKVNIIIVEQQNKRPVAQYYFSKEEWDRLGCGPLPPERDRALQHENVHARGNPPTDNNAIKGYN